MSNFYQTILSLMEQVKIASKDTQRCSERLNTPPEFDVIDWLDAQPLFPKFYWQTRDADEEVIALGQLQSFNDPEPAYDVISGDQRVWGGSSFDGGSKKNPDCPASFFFLPFIELIRQDNEWYLAANIGNNKQTTLSQLAALTDSVTALDAINVEVTELTHSPSFEGWGTLVNDVLKGVNQQCFKKVVLARETTLNLKGTLKATQLLKVSRQQNANSFHFLLSLNERYSFVGSPPERLYLRQDRIVHTEALAGTIGRGDTEADDNQLAQWLLQDPKNRNENQYVVDDIVSHLSPCSDQVDVDADAQLVALRKVQHLKRGIRSQIKPYVNGVHLLGALHPTAAVAGLPRKEAKTFIEEQEPFVRGWYAGAIGYFSHDQAQFCVAIRSALVLENMVKLYAGAGIVPGSQIETEWTELNKKVSTLLSLISQDCLQQEVLE